MAPIDELKYLDENAANEIRARYSEDDDDWWMNEEAKAEIRRIEAHTERMALTADWFPSL